MPATTLEHRALIRLSGEDVRGFLQGLVTNDVTGALPDLQTYLKLSSAKEMDKDARDEHEQIWEHVKTLRRRVAGYN